MGNVKPVRNDKGEQEFNPLQANLDPILFKEFSKIMESKA